MPKPFIYFACETTMPRERAAALGLGYLAEFQARGGPGPEGRHGVQFGSGILRAPARWEPHLEAEGVWVGWDPDDPPGPRELARADQVGGHFVRLGDGRDWLIPVATRFPRRIGWRRPEGGGDPVIEVKPTPADAAHRRLWDLADRWFAAAAAAAGKPSTMSLNMREAWDGVADALAVNYQVSRTELDILGLVTTTHWSGVLEALCDIPSLIQMREAPPDRPNSEGPTPARGPEAS